MGALSFFGVLESESALEAFLATAGLVTFCLLVLLT